MEAIRNDAPLDELETEGWDPAGADLDLRPTEELVRLMGEADATVPHAVAEAREALAAAIDDIAGRLVSGGRLVYVGAGTSGRLPLADVRPIRDEIERRVRTLLRQLNVAADPR